MAVRGVIANMISSTWCIRKYLIQIGIANNENMVTVSIVKLRNS